MCIFGKLSSLKIQFMNLPLFNSIASWLLKKRLHQIELFVKYPADVQHELLLKLVDMAVDTEVGRRYHFEEISNY